MDNHNEDVIDENSMDVEVESLSNTPPIYSTQDINIVQENDNQENRPDTPIILTQNSTNSVETKNDETDDECKCNCKKHKKRRFSDADDEEEGKLCPICFDVWTNSGEHRLCSLRCGHLFGHNCVERWLSGQKSCPTCKRPTKKTDIRFIYARKLIQVDTSELTTLRLELDTEKCEKNRLHIDLIHTKQREELQKQEITDLKRQVETLKTSVPISNSQGTTFTNHWKIYKEKSLEISKDGGCRVMDFYKNSNLLVVSAQSSNPLFAGYGIRKISIPEFKNSIFVPLHSNSIRDLSFHQQRELLLSVSVDKSFRLTETLNNKTVSSSQLSGPIWSCCWDTTNPNYFYIGEQSGSVAKYDLRKTAEKLSLYMVPGDYSPVVSLASAGWCPGGAMPHGGIITCKLNSCTIFTESPHVPGHNIHPLSLEGPFVSMRYDNITGHLLVTSRPNVRFPFARHSLCTLAKDSKEEDAIVCNSVHVFQGAPVQKLLSRSCQMNVAGDVLVAAHHETNKVVDVWSVASRKKCSSLPAHLPVLDLCPVSLDSTQFLCTLNEKKVEFFKLDL